MDRNRMNHNARITIRLLFLGLVIATLAMCARSALAAPTGDPSSPVYPDTGAYVIYSPVVTSYASPAPVTVNNSLPAAPDIAPAPLPTNTCILQGFNEAPYSIVGLQVMSNGAWVSIYPSTTVVSYDGSWYAEVTLSGAPGTYTVYATRTQASPGTSWGPGPIGGAMTSCVVN